MKKFIILLLLFSISIIANNKINLKIYKGESYFFVFNSDFPYSMRVEDKNCLSINSMSNDILEPTAIDIYSLKNKKCKKNQLVIIDFWSNNKKYSYKLPIILLDKGENYDKDYKIPKNHINNQKYPDSINLGEMFTPSRHLMISIIKNRLYSTPKIEKKRNNEIYQITLPWFCLEFCDSSRDAATEYEEIRRNFNALTAISYERYTMDGGVWGRHTSLTNPTSNIKSDNLGAWPMINADTRGHDTDYIVNYINQIWNNKEQLATQMVDEAVTNGYAGYCLDIETQQITTDVQNKYILLVDYFSKELHKVDKKLMVAHAHWSTIAPMKRLSDETVVDYVATMDPYTASELFFNRSGDETRGQAYEDYNDIDHNRLIWAFAWEYHIKSTQENMWQWLENGGYNDGVAGAAVWRTPAENMCKSGCNRATDGINYYEAFERYYPVNSPYICKDIACSNHGECRAIDGNAVCNCEEGYHAEGTNCIIDNNLEKILTINENFTYEGAAPYWNRDNIGIDNNSIYCYNNSIDTSNKGVWSISGLIEDSYQIFAHIPNGKNMSKEALYYLEGEESKTVTIDQTQNVDSWVLLGTIDSKDSIKIKLNCISNENKLDFRRLYFDAIKIKAE